MERILEPEIMEDRGQAVAYAEADFSTSNQWYVDRLIAELPAGPGRVIDLGCGPADVMIRLARGAPGAAITAVDGSAEMIALARTAVAAAGLASRIRLLTGRLPGLQLPAHGFDAVLSKDLLHHLPDPKVLWDEAIRLAKPGAVVFVMDLIRPESRADARNIVEAAAAEEDPILKEDFYHSLCAAFTLREVAGQLSRAGLKLEVSRAGERHFLAKGILR